MASVECPHADAPAYGRVCRHLLESSDPDDVSYQRFTGIDIEYDFICSTCLNNPGQIESCLRYVCQDCFERIAENRETEVIIGRPAIRYRPTTMHFQHKQVGILDGWPREGLVQSPTEGESSEIADVTSRGEYWDRRMAELAKPLFDNVLDIQSIDDDSAPTFLAVTAGGELARFDFADHRVSMLAKLDPSDVSLDQNVSLHLSRDGRLAVVVNTYGTRGIVCDLLAGQMTMRLERDGYHSSFSRFPVAFFELDGQLLLAHATTWNRLDISDPMTGLLMTQRPTPVYERGRLPDHYLDYFHCSLFVSPEQDWIIEDGWIWHPRGAVTSWNLRRWVQNNVWESEDGPTKRKLCYRDYFWDGPLCWIGNSQVAVWGYGGDDYSLLPAVRIFDVVSGSELSWFAGPEDSQVPDGQTRKDVSASGAAMPWQRQGAFTFDKYLFSCTALHGTSVWDVETGERLLHDPDFHPIRYHHGAKCFLSVLPDGSFQLSHLRDG